MEGLQDEYLLIVLSAGARMCGINVHCASLLAKIKSFILSSSNPVILFEIDGAAKRRCAQRGVLLVGVRLFACCRRCSRKNLICHSCTLRLCSSSVRAKTWEPSLRLTKYR